MVVLLATAGYDYTIRFWDASAGSVYKTLQHPGKQVNSLVISPDKQFVAAGGNPHIKLYDVNAKGTDPVATFEGHTGNVTSVGFQKDGRWMYSSSEDGTVKVWDPRAPGFQREYEARAGVNSVVLHPNQGELIAGDHSGMVRVLDLIANACSAELVPEGDAPISSVAMAADASLLVAANFNGNCYFWNRRAQQEEFGQPSTADSAADAAPSSTAEQDGGATSPSTSGGAGGAGAATPATPGVATTPSSSHRDSRTWRLDSASYTPVKRLSAHKAYILSARMSPDARFLATASSDRSVKLWRVGDGTYALAATLQGHQRWVWDAVFSADSNYLVTASSDNSSKLWEVASGEVVRTYTGHSKAVTAVALNDAPPVLPPASHASTGTASSREEEKR